LSIGLNLRFAGRYSPDQLSDINGSIDVGVVPSKWEEVFGLVGVEFLQCHVPLITSNLGGMKDYVRNGENGLMFRAGNSADLYEVMNRLVQEPGLIRHLQKGCRPWHTTGELQDRLSSLYTQLLTQRSIANPLCQIYQT
jgi:glycosyltransferase involved in cell wall biosynthesis